MVPGQGAETNSAVSIDLDVPGSTGISAAEQGPSLAATSMQWSPSTVHRELLRDAATALGFRRFDAKTVGRLRSA